MAAFKLKINKLFYFLAKGVPLGLVSLIQTSLGDAFSNSTFQVSANIVASCTITANNLAFGNYTLGQLDATSTVITTCTNGTSYTIGLDAGTFSGATTITRQMTGPSSSSLKYNLYSDSGRTTTWGNVSGSWVTGTGTGTAQTLTIYGRIPANQPSPIGNYSDTITVTVTF